MSHKVLPSFQNNKNRTFFYKSPQIRFKDLISKTITKPPRHKIIIEQNPWRSIKESEISKLIARLEDTPEDLYEAIKRRNNNKNKFILLSADNNKENTKMLEAIETKKKYYETEFRTLLKNRKSQAIKILLPKLQSVHYIFKDKLHKLNKVQKPIETPSDWQ